MNQQGSSFIFNIDDNLSSYDQCDIHTFTDLAIDLCHQNYFDDVKNIVLLQNLNKFKDLNEYFGHENHPSLPKILSDIGNKIADTSLSQLALPFYIEQLRIEKYYLGCSHPDLASVLFSIGQIYERHNHFTNARNYLEEALSLLNSNRRKGRLYMLVTYNLGLVDYRQSLFNDAMKQFNLALLEVQNETNKFDPDIAEFHLKVGKLQLEIGKLQDAMDNFLKALMIMRMVFGNNHFKVAECLYGIAMIHEARAEIKQSLNVLCQAVVVYDSAENDEDDNFMLVMLHRIALICAEIEEPDEALKVLQNFKDVMQLNAFNDIDVQNVFAMLGSNAKNIVVHAAAAA